MRDWMYFGIIAFSTFSRLGSKVYNGVACAAVDSGIGPESCRASGTTSTGSMRRTRTFCTTMFTNSVNTMYSSETPP